MILDLSPHGCRIETPLRLHVGQHYTLMLQFNPVTPPIRIEKAHVCWKSQDLFGLMFDNIEPTNRIQLESTVEQHAFDAQN